MVTLRGYATADTNDVVAYAQDEQVQRWTALPNPYTRRDADSFMASGAEAWRRGGDRSFAIETRGRWCGGIDIRPGLGGAAEVGYGLAAWARGSGVMRRALKLALPWAFSALDLGVVQWKAHVGNWDSRRVAWRSGFQIGPALPALLDHRGRREDAWYGVLRRDEPMVPLHPWHDAVTLAGPSVVLRAHRDDDLPRVFEAAGDERTQRWLYGLPAPYSMESAREHVLQIRTEAATGRRLTWAVADPATDLLIGEVGIALREPNGNENEVGYWAHPDARGRGAMTQATRLAVRHALLPAEAGGMGLHRVFIRAAEANSASRWVAVQAGFTEVGRDRGGSPLRDGTMSDDIRYDLLASELPAVR